MKKKTLLTFILLVLQVVAFGQADSCFTLLIRPSYAGIPIPFDRIDIENITKGTSFTMEDTILTNCPVGISDYGRYRDYTISDCYPNPFAGNTKVQISVPVPGKLYVELCDFAGKILTAHSFNLKKGSHLMRVEASAPGLYILRTMFEGQCRQIKMISSGIHSGKNLVEITSFIPVEEKDSSTKTGQDVSIGDRLSIRIHYTSNDHPHPCIIDSISSGLLVAETQNPVLGDELAWEGYSLANKRVDLVANRYFALSHDYSDTLVVYKHIYFYDSTLYVSPGNLACEGLMSLFGLPYYYHQENEDCWPFMGWYKYETASAAELYPEDPSVSPDNYFLLLYTMGGDYLGMRALAPRHSNFPNVFTIFSSAYPPGHPLYMEDFTYITAKIIQ